MGSSNDNTTNKDTNQLGGGPTLKETLQEANAWVPFTGGNEANHHSPSTLNDPPLGPSDDVKDEKGTKKAVSTKLYHMDAPMAQTLRNANAATPVVSSKDDRKNTENDADRTDDAFANEKELHDIQHAKLESMDQPMGKTVKEAYTSKLS